MIDWAIEAWNDYGKDLKEHLRNEEVIKSIECADDDSYINLAKLVISKILNKGLENRCFNIGISSIHIGTDSIEVLKTGRYIGEIHLIFPVYIGTEYCRGSTTIDYYYTTVVYGSCSACDAMQYALSSDGDERIQALMIIALTMVQNLRRIGDE